MNILPLSTIPFTQVLTCFNTSFEGYFVPMPTTIEFWETRFSRAKVNWDLSYGMFDDTKLVGFVIHAIGEFEGEITAYNTGTGVLPDYRGRSIVDQLYCHAKVILVDQGIEKGLLEVITLNDRAIKVYERIGFSIISKMICYKRTSEEHGMSDSPFESISSAEFFQETMKYQKQYSWDNTEMVLKKDNEHLYLTSTIDSKQVFFSLNPTSGSISQINAPASCYMELVNEIVKTYPNARINNVKNNRENLNKALLEAGFENTVDQYLMSMTL